MIINPLVSGSPMAGGGDLAISLSGADSGFVEADSRETTARASAQMSPSKRKTLSKRTFAVLNELRDFKPVACGAGATRKPCASFFFTFAFSFVIGTWACFVSCKREGIANCT